MELELTIERSYQTHSHNVHFQITGLVRRFSRRRNMSSSRIHGCYLILNTEFKLFCCVIVSSGLKEKQCFMWLRWRNIENRLSFSPWELQTTISSSGAPDIFLLGDPRLLVNLPRNSLSQYLPEIVKIILTFSHRYLILILLSLPRSLFSLPWPNVPCVHLACGATFSFLFAISAKNVKAKKKKATAHS